MVTLEKLINDPYITELLKESDATAEKLGITEHGQKHATITAEYAKKICEGLQLDQSETMMAIVASYVHDVGNLTGREIHGQIGSAILVPILMKHNVDPLEMARIVSAVAHHDDEEPRITNTTTAIVIMADKSDVRRSRVRNPFEVEKDIHDRVNFAVTESNIIVKGTDVSLSLTLDETIACTADYLEIFSGRMIAMRTAAKFLGCQYELVINGNRIL